MFGMIPLRTFDAWNILEPFFWFYVANYVYRHQFPSKGNIISCKLFIPFGVTWPWRWLFFRFGVVSFCFFFNVVFQNDVPQHYGMKLTIWTTNVPSTQIVTLCPSQIATQKSSQITNSIPPENEHRYQKWWALEDVSTLCISYGWFGYLAVKFQGG